MKSGVDTEKGRYTDKYSVTLKLTMPSNAAILSYWYWKRDIRMVYSLSQEEQNDGEKVKNVWSEQGRSGKLVTGKHIKVAQTKSTLIHTLCTYRHLTREIVTKNTV